MSVCVCVCVHVCTCVCVYVCVCMYVCMFPKLALANGVLTVLVRGPCRVSRCRRGNRRSNIVVNTSTNAAVPQKPFVK